MADTPPLDLYPLVRSLKSLLYGIADETLAIATPCPGWSVGDLIDHLTSSTWAFTRAARKATTPQDAAHTATTPQDAAHTATTPQDATTPRDPAAHTDAPQQAETTTPPPPSAGNLHPQWRSRLPPWLDELADSWADPAAWTGTARLGGATLPAERMGLLAATELTVHGWDLARATGQNFAVDPRFLEILVGFLATPPEGADRAGPDGDRAGPDGDSAGPDGDRPRLRIPEQRIAQRHRPEDFDGSSPWLRVAEIEDADPLLDRLVALSGRDPAWQPRRVPKPGLDERRSSRV